MGSFKKLSTKVIFPSQNFLKEDTIKHILKCINENKEEKLPPTPMITRHPEKEDMFIAIDGHNLLAVFDMLGRPCNVFVVESREDFLENLEKNPAIEKRNLELQEKFDFCLEWSTEIEKEGIKSFEDLREKHKL